MHLNIALMSSGIQQKDLIAESFFFNLFSHKCCLSNFMVYQMKDKQHNPMHIHWEVSSVTFYETDSPVIV